MLKPAQVDITAWRKGTFENKLVFWKNTADTEKYNLTGYIIRFVIDGGLTLTVGSGLEVKNENELIIKMTPAQTTAANKLSRSHYHIELEHEGEVLIPIRGLITFETP